ncbi:MAG TPA: hypothetical protein PKU97_20035 [Kofleriaceae bacterium]|nr:hypothetical protein [Kofleriaceae bacterium]
MRSRATLLLLFLAGLLVYGALAGARLWRPSAAPHFVVQADAWLHGRSEIAPPWPGDDWAKVETVQVQGAQGAANRIVRGRRLQTRSVFRTTDGELVPLAQLGPSLGVSTYVSFPPAPTLLMLPSALVSGRHGNDVIPTVIIAALILPLAFSMLRRLAAAGLSQRTPGEDLWWVATLGFGSVLLFSAVGGKVWYTAHVLGVALALLYVRAAIEAKHPLLAGLALGAAALTRTPMAFLAPLFLLELWRQGGGGARFAQGQAQRVAMLRELAPALARFAAPVIALAVLAMAYNQARFDAPLEFGHSYLDVRQQQQIETFGLFSYHYLARNLAVALTLLPELPGAAPWVQIGGHGLALWVTTPVLLLALWPRRKTAIDRGLWWTVAAVAVPSLFYQNSGWVQFGYRFSLDYLVLLIALLAVGGRPLTRLARTLILVGVAINLFGAITFERMPQFYRWHGDAYGVVVAH